MCSTVRAGVTTGGGEQKQRRGGEGRKRRGGRKNKRMQQQGQRGAGKGNCGRAYHEEGFGVEDAELGRSNKAVDEVVVNVQVPGSAVKSLHIDHRPGRRACDDLHSCLSSPRCLLGRELRNLSSAPGVRQRKMTEQVDEDVNPLVVDQPSCFPGGAQLGEEEETMVRAVGGDYGSLLPGSTAPARACQSLPASGSLPLSCPARSTRNISPRTCTAVQSTARCSSGLPPHVVPAEQIVEQPMETRLREVAGEISQHDPPPSNPRTHQRQPTVSQLHPQLAREAPLALQLVLGREGKERQLPWL
eukprot:759724-Hanusia_phi.AAC.3